MQRSVMLVQRNVESMATNTANTVQLHASHVQTLVVNLRNKKLAAPRGGYFFCVKEYDKANMLTINVPNPIIMEIPSKNVMCLTSFV